MRDQDNPFQTLVMESNRILNFHFKRVRSVESQGNLKNFFGSWKSHGISDFSQACNEIWETLCQSSKLSASGTFQSL